MKKIVVFIITFLLVPFTTYASDKEEVKFSKCVDGDTAKFIYKGEVETFRFLALDTPESTNKIEKHGKEASNYTCEMLTNATKIEIEFDASSDQKDKYGRYLVWVYIDNTLLNNDIVRKGYGEVAYLYGNYAYTNTLKESEALAKEEKLNIWSDYEEEDNTLLYIFILLVIIILCITNKSFRKETINKIKKVIKKYFKKIS